MLELDKLTIFDYQLLITTVLFILLGVAHEWAGIQTYIKGSSLDVFRTNSSWIPETGKEKTLLGVFFMISFAWWQGQILLILLILIGNPLGYLLGIIVIVFNFPQLLLLRKYIPWNKAAQFVVLIHILSVAIWLTPFFIN